MTPILHKKVLIVSSWAPPRIGASPHFFYNIFSLIDPTRYAFYTSARKLDAYPGGETLQCAYYFYNRVSSKYLPAFLNRLLEALHMVSEGMRVMHEETAELLMGLSDDGPGLLLTGILSTLTRTPYVLYLFDPYKGGPFGKFKNLLATLFEGLLFRHAQCIIVTSEALAEVYRRRYGDAVSIEVINNSLTPPASLVSCELQKPNVILYSGNIYWAQEKSIRSLIRVVRALNEPGIVIKLYVPKDAERFAEQFAGDHVEVGTATSDEILFIQRQSVVLFLPLVWSENSRLVIETALPGKMTEYLVAGRPILVHAPPYSYLARYARDNGFALVVDSEDDAALASGVRTLLTDTALGAKLVRNAKALFAKNHDATKNASRLVQILNTL